MTRKINKAVNFESCPNIALFTAINTKKNLTYFGSHCNFLPDLTKMGGDKSGKIFIDMGFLAVI